MGIISSHMRQDMPKEEFGLPTERKYPMPDAAHTQNAEARATQQVAKGNLTMGQKMMIDAKAHKLLGRKGGKK